ELLAIEDARPVQPVHHARIGIPLTVTFCGVPHVPGEVALAIDQRQMVVALRIGSRIIRDWNVLPETWALMKDPAIRMDRMARRVLIHLINRNGEFRRIHAKVMLLVGLQELDPGRAAGIDLGVVGNRLIPKTIVAEEALRLALLR